MKTSKVLSLIILTLICFNCFAQLTNNEFERELKFYKYLQQKELYSEGNYFLSKLSSANLSVQQRDSVNWLKAVNFFNIKKLDSAIGYFSNISIQSSYINKVKIYNAYCNMFLQNYNAAYNSLNSFAASDTMEMQLNYFQQAGLALFNKKYNKFDSLINSVNESNYLFATEKPKLVYIKNRMEKYKPKSAFVAGALSAILPGLGKFYAGKKKEAFGGFLPIAVAGFLTYEAYQYNGIRDYRFWLFGSLFTTFYIGNIWGSVVTVRVKEFEIKKINENAILFNLQIPIRNFYN